MMPIVSAGTTLHVATDLPTTNDQAGFDALSWTQVRGVRIIGDIGKQYNTSPYYSFGMSAPINKRYGLKAMSLNIELIRIVDAGQTIVRLAIDGDSCSYQVTEPDGSKKYFTAKASSRMSGLGEPKTIADTKVILELDAPALEI